MLFDYEAYKEELMENPQKKHIIQDWSKYSNAMLITDEPFYKYLEKFKTIPYKVPEDFKKDFDWDLLLRIIAGSFSSDYEFEFPDIDLENIVNEEMLYPELIIHVSSGDQQVSKKITELWSFQILRLFEIYCEEQINLHKLKIEDENEKNAIDEERKLRIKKYNLLSKNAENIFIRNSCFLG